MTLKRFCDICKEEAIGGYAYFGTSKTETEVIDMCKKCESIALAALKERKRETERNK